VADVIRLQSSYYDQQGQCQVMTIDNILADIVSCYIVNNFLAFCKYFYTKNKSTKRVQVVLFY